MAGGALGSRSGGVRRYGASIKMMKMMEGHGLVEAAMVKQGAVQVARGGGGLGGCGYGGCHLVAGGGG
ncbi:hypothetical protein Dimus_024317 [Dionaea muscipula]